MKKLCKNRTFIIVVKIKGSIYKVTKIPLPIIHQRDILTEKGRYFSKRSSKAFWETDLTANCAFTLMNSSTRLSDFFSIRR